jgi:hypothetical protein
MADHGDIVRDEEGNTECIVKGDAEDVCADESVERGAAAVDEVNQGISALEAGAEDGPQECEAGEDTGDQGEESVEDSEAAVAENTEPAEAGVAEGGDDLEAGDIDEMASSPIHLNSSVKFLYFHTILNGTTFLPPWLVLIQLPAELHLSRCRRSAKGDPPPQKPLQTRLPRLMPSMMTEVWVAVL